MDKMKSMPANVSSRHLFFIVVTWASIFALGLVILVSDHVTRTGNSYWSSTSKIREAARLGDSIGSRTGGTMLPFYDDGFTRSGTAWTGAGGGGAGGDVGVSSVEDSTSRSVLAVAQGRDVPEMVEGVLGGAGGPLESRSSRFRCVNGTPTNIVFIKVHKSGSTTIANLLARYALCRGLNVALPDRPPGTARFNYFNARRLERRVIPPPRGQPYHVLFNHMIYNRTALDRLMPPRTFYCGIMREPLSRFISSVNYYHTMLPPNLKQYLLFGPKAIRQWPATKQELPKYHPSLDRVDLKQLLVDQERTLVEQRCEVFNSLAWDTGLQGRLQSQHSAVVEHVLKLNRELDLMMVMEHFHESLVLLKRRACLSMKDIVYSKLNSARTNSARKLTDEDAQTVRAWQAADHYLYDFFYKKFQNEVRKEGETFWQETDAFKKILSNVQTFCDQTLSSQGRVLRVAAGPWNEEFTLNAEDCELMKMKEVAMQRRLIDRAWNRIAESTAPAKPGRSLSHRGTRNH